MVLSDCSVAVGEFKAGTEFVLSIVPVDKKVQFIFAKFENTVSVGAL